MSNIGARFMPFLSDDERRRIERFLRDTIRFGIEEPEMNDLLNSYSFPLRTIIETVNDIEEDWDELKDVGRVRSSEIDILEKRIDDMLVGMDEYEVRTVKTDMVQLKSNVDDDDFKNVIGELSRSILETMAMIRKEMANLKKKISYKKERFAKREVDVFFLDEDKKKKK